MCGRIYLDLFWRPTKIRGAAAFVVQSARHVDGERQLPVITIVASFARPLAGHPHLLSHGSVETLFHEFGHATQHILCRNNYQHLSGARGELDFVELPSILFEHFIWDYRVLKHFAHHYATPHQTIPQQMVHNLAASKFLFFGMDTQQQAAHALFDQALFGTEYQRRLRAGENDDGRSNGSSGVLSSKLYGEMMVDHTVLPYVDGTHPHATNAHLCHYGAGYYSYLMCRVYATALWAKWFANDPLSSQSGEEYRRCVLAWGGAKDPRQILTEVLGEDHMEKAIAHFIKQSS